MRNESNWGMIGNEWAVQLLRDHIAHDRLRHAYLFTGPQGVGRRTLALRFIQALNCPHPTAPGEPCRTCRSCTHVEAMQHPDLQVLQAEKIGGVLKVEQVREMQRSLSLSPYEARYRTTLLLRFEEAHPSAMNALLKTLEEPGPQVILLLTAGSVEQLLPTVASRCEVLRLRPAPLEKIAYRLEHEWGLEPARAALLAHLSGGRPGYALGLHTDPQLFETRRTHLDDLAGIVANGRVERFAYVENLAKNKDKARAALVAWLSFWRDVMMETAGAPGSIINLDQAASIERIAGRLDLQTAHRAVRAIEETLNYVDQNVNLRLALETLMLELPNG